MNPHFFALPFDESTGQDGTFGKIPRFEVVGEMRGHPILQEKAEVDIMFLLRSISDEFFQEDLTTLCPVDLIQGLAGKA